MAGTQNSISSLVAQFLRLQKNALEIINGLNEVATSTNETVSIEVLDDNGNPTTASIPSYGYMRAQIERIDNNIKSLAGISNGSTVRNPDGTYSQVFKAEPLKNPAPMRNLPVPGTFQTKDNWFFESFLSPLLYVSIDVTGKISENADRILIKRIIANTTTQAQKDFFDNSLKGRNDVSYDTFVTELTAAGIQYFTDESLEQLPLRKLRYTGSFGVTSFYDSVVSTTSQNGQLVQTTVRNYKLASLKYTDTTTGVKNSKTLNNGDRLATADGTIYLITSVNVDESSVQLQRVSGYQQVFLGADTLSYFSNDLGDRFVDVNIGNDERQGVFFKTIDDNFNIVSSEWSTGITFWSSELTTLDSAGNLVSLEQFYLTQVADIGKVFLDMAKEKTVPAIQGLTPNVPTVAETNFKVVQINKQVTDSVSSKTATDKVAAKSSLKTELVALDASINQTMVQLNQAKSLGATKSSSGAISTIQAKLDSLINEKSKKSQLYSSIVKDIQTTTSDLSQIDTQPKYRVRGFWAIPDPVFDPLTGSQQVIAFKVRYRYLSDSGATQPTEQIKFVDNNGQQKTGAFSNWVEYTTPIRKKVYDENKGVYVWAPENVDNADAQNINQIDIPIQKGEKVEIQISSVSEAGWPNNPHVSIYSDPVSISFPSDLAVNGITDLLKKNSEDSAVVTVQESLTAQGLPQHLSEQFTENVVTYFHQGSSIASGFFNSAGGTISIFDKLAELQQQIATLQSLVSVTVGVLEVYLLDGTSSLQVSAGQVISLNAGYYNDLFDLTVPANIGKIYTKTYLISLTNSQATPVELQSIVPGGFTTQAPISTYPQIDGYGTNLRYGAVPLSVTTYASSDVVSNTNIYQAAPFACAQTYGQYTYSRYKNIGLDQDLYLTSSQIPTFNPLYDYSGSTPSTSFFGVTGGIMPLNGSCLIPYDPQNTPATASGGTASSIWSGLWSGTTPQGGGYVSEFCIATTHPALNTGATGDYVTYVKPNFDNTVTGSILYPAFRHALGFYADTALPEYYTQTQYRTPTAAAGATAASFDIYDSQWQDRVGFNANDQYLIGKYSCGAYLFLGIPQTTYLAVDGFTSQASKRIYQGQNNSVNIPVIFQFRAQDVGGYIGGYRKAGTLSNVTYTKKIGIDLQQRAISVFSFDIEVTGAYRNQTLIAPNFGSQVTPPANSTVNIINNVLNA